MTQHLIKRVFATLITMVVVATMVFFLLRAIPGDPVALFLGPEATPELIAQVRHQLGLDKPLPIQYIRWFQNLLTGKWGKSLIYKEQVLTLIIQSFPRTLSIGALGMLLAIFIALPAGIISAVKKHSLADHIATTVAFFGLSMPYFWLGILLMLTFGVTLHWLPIMGYVSPFEEGFLSWLRHIILPAIAAGTPFAAIITRMTRSSLLEVLNEVYISTARSKGLKEGIVILKHGLRNALIPIITVSGISFGLLLINAVVVEEVFSIHGVGRLLIKGIINRDYPVVQAAILLISFTFIFINLIVDILYVFINPKIRYER